MKSYLTVQIFLSSYSVDFLRVSEIGRHTLSVVMQNDQVANMSRLPKIFDDNPTFEIHIKKAAADLSPTDVILAKLINFDMLDNWNYSANFRFISGHSDLARLLTPQH